jgi:hypothetical protein
MDPVMADEAVTLDYRQHGEEARRQLILKRLTVPYAAATQPTDGRTTVLDALCNMPDERLDYLARTICSAYEARCMGMRQHEASLQASIGQMVLDIAVDYAQAAIAEHELDYVVQQLAGDSL